MDILNSAHTFSVVGSRDATEEELNTLVMITAEAAEKALQLFQVELAELIQLQ